MTFLLLWFFIGSIINVAFKDDLGFPWIVSVILRGPIGIVWSFLKFGYKYVKADLKVYQINRGIE